MSECLPTYRGVPGIGIPAKANGHLLVHTSSGLSASGYVIPGRAGCTHTQKKKHITSMSTDFSDLLRNEPPIHRISTMTNRATLAACVWCETRRTRRKPSPRTAPTNTHTPTHCRGERRTPTELVTALGAGALGPASRRLVRCGRTHTEAPSPPLIPTQTNLSTCQPSSLTLSLSTTKN